MQNVWLHGTPHVTVIEADNIKPQRRLRHAPKCIRKVVECFESLIGREKKSSDCYVAVTLADTSVAQTSVTHNTTHPRWNERFRINCAHEVSELLFMVKDNRPVGAETLGAVRVLASDLLSGQTLRGWSSLLDCDESPMKGKLHTTVQFVHVEQEPAYQLGAMKDPFTAAPVAYYSLQRGCHITPYQDAHVKNDFQPSISLHDGKVYQPARCWEDVYLAISNAQHFVYIVGWSVYAKIALVRDPERAFPGSEGMTLGELLIRKADTGVRVLMLVWDDKTSVNAPLLRSLTHDGVMATHDEDTRGYFKDSKVVCVLCPRNPSSELSAVRSAQVRSMFTHHQKAVIADVAAVGEPLDSPDRRVVAFVGGIDLCDGRYDTQQHPLFATLNTTHRDDFHQPCVGDADLSKGGPREPWHDIHCKVEGPAAWDVLQNFERRWLKQAGRFIDSAPLLLLPVRKIRSIQPPSALVPESDPSETWMCQVFRSIDMASVAGFPTATRDAFNAALSVFKGNIVDQSAQNAYIHAIRRAQRFIYIENQYFLGSCHAWSLHNDAGCLNLIPIEIALKIAAKIRAGEPFAAYVVIPMFPEGKPNSGSVQEILYWQRLTMEMMYSTIIKALRAAGRYDEQPTNYLRFFCLANRETSTPDESTPSQELDPQSFYGRAQRERRFMIYVHAKMLIVDDEYMIIGSANINQRSMDGARDTEIAVGSFQPAHTWAAQNAPPKGQIHGFRMSLWAEHTRTLADEFLQPWTLGCMRHMASIGSKNWETFTAPKVADMEGHLMTYPISVGPDGSIAPLLYHENFPDTEAAPVLGTKSAVLPDILTT